MPRVMSVRDPSRAASRARQLRGSHLPGAEPRATQFGEPASVKALRAGEVCTDAVPGPAEPAGTERQLPPASGSTAPDTAGCLARGLHRLLARPLRWIPPRRTSSTRGAGGPTAGPVA